jgi:NarL family two-component system response regulator LiaR
MTNKSITVMIVDDHEMVRNGLRTFLDAHPAFEVIGEAGSGIEALAIIERNPPDVVLMDLLMPKMDGVEATRKIRAISPSTQIVVVTSFHDDEYIFPALKAGAISYLLKDIPMDELAAALIHAANGEATLHPKVASKVIKEISGIKDDEINPYTELSERELEVLQKIATGASNSEIAGTLFISENTVKRHVSNILNKLHLADRTHAAVYAWQQGLIRRNNS